MDDLLFALNGTMPIFLLIVIGYILKRVGWLDEAFAGKLNTLVFRFLLPALLFADLATVDLQETWNTKFILFCTIATVLSILIAGLISKLLKNRSERGEFIQASFRSSQAILGIAFIQNMYGSAGMAPLMILGSVPVYNIAAAVILSVTAPGTSEEKERGLIRRSAIGVLTNPIIIGVLAGFLWSALKLPAPAIMMNTVSRIGACATPLGLMAMGAGFSFEKALKTGKAASLATFIKLIGLGLIFVPVSYGLGFRGEEMVALLVMFCSSTTVSSFVMAKSMGHEGTLTSAVVMMTTLFAAFTLTLWIFVLKALGVI